MAEKTPQTYSNHVRWDPLFHFLALPVMLLSAIAMIVLFILHPGLHSAWIFVISVALAIITLKTRLYALRVQDRVIRLEERLRLSQVLSEPLRSRIPELTEGQLIGLRFAPDSELPALVERALTEKLSRGDIKKQVKNWRPDYWRV